MKSMRQNTFLLAAARVTASHKILFLFLCGNQNFGTVYALQELRRDNSFRSPDGSILGCNCGVQLNNFRELGDEVAGKASLE